MLEEFENEFEIEETAAVEGELEQAGELDADAAPESDAEMAEEVGDELPASAEPEGADASDTELTVEDEADAEAEVEADAEAAPAALPTSFGTVTDRLNEIAEVMQDDTMPLDDALDLLEEAVALGMQASNLLESDMNERDAAEEEAEAALAAEDQALEAELSGTA